MNLFMLSEMSTNPIKINLKLNKIILFKPNSVTINKNSFQLINQKLKQNLVKHIFSPILLFQTAIRYCYVEKPMRPRPAFDRASIYLQKS